MHIRDIEGRNLKPGKRQNTANLIDISSHMNHLCKVCSLDHLKK